MKIAIYYGKNDGMRSLKILTDDLCNRLEGAYPVAKVKDLKGADIILNIVIDDVPKIEEGRRFIGYGRQVCFFTSNVKEHSYELMLGLLIYNKKIPLILHSYFHDDEVKECISDFNPSLRRTIANNTHLCLCGITDDFKSTKSNIKENWMVPYNRVNKYQKNFDLHNEVTNKIMAACALKKIKAPTQKLYLLDFEDFDAIAGNYDMSGYEMAYCPADRKDYMENAKKTGMFICTSNFESFGLMYLELLACGVVGIFLDKPWVRQLLPEYKLIANKDELADMALSVYTNYDKASNYVHKKAIPYIRDHYSFDVFTGLIKTVLEDEYERSRKNK